MRAGRISYRKELIPTAVIKRGAAKHRCRSNHLGEQIHECTVSKRLSLQSKCPADTSAGSVVAPRKAWWRPAIPVAVKREVPL